MSTANSDTKNLQNLKMVLSTLIDNCVQSTDWENKLQALRQKELLYQRITKSVSQIFSRIGGCPANPKQIQYPNQAQQNAQSELANDNITKDIMFEETTDTMATNLQTSLNTLSDTFGEKLKEINDKSYAKIGQNQQVNCKPPSYDDQQDITQMSIANKHSLKDESDNCLRMANNTHPFKQRLMNQQHQSREQQVKQRIQNSEDEYSPDDNESEFNESDEEFSLSGKKKKIQKKKHAFGFPSSMQNRGVSNQHQQRLRRGSNFQGGKEDGPQSVNEAPLSEKRKVLQYFKQHYDPAKRNKIEVVHKICSDRNYSYTSIYYLVSNPSTIENESDSDSSPLVKVAPKSYKPPNKVEQQLYQQKQQQQQYYLQRNMANGNNYKKEQYLQEINRNRISQSQSSNLQHHQMQKINPSFNDRYKNEIKEQKSIANERYALSLLQQQQQQQNQLQPKNLQMLRQSSNNNPQQPKQTPSNKYLNSQEMTQSDSDSGIFDKSQNRQDEVDKMNDVVKQNQSKYQIKQRSAEHQRYYGHQIDHSKSTNSHATSDNCQNIFSEQIRSTSRDTIQLQQQQQMQMQMQQES